MKISLMHYYKKLIQIFILFFGALFYSQSYKEDSLRGEFTYQLKAKFDNRTENRNEELFILQVGNKRAFFASAVSLKGDSVMTNSGITSNNPDGSITLGWKAGATIPKTIFNFTIIQSTEDIQYFDSAFMSLLMYREPIIKNWKLSNETKMINTITCKKANVTFKGRHWIAWYSPDIPFPYGPMKFNGLPGLIVKITDDRGDYDFELVKSVPASKLKGKLISIKKSRYIGATETTQTKLKQAQRNTQANVTGVLASYGATILQGQEMLKQREKEQEENKKYENPLELAKD